MLNIKKLIILVIVACFAFTKAGIGQAKDNSYSALVKLFAEWRAFEVPPYRDGAPDYTQSTFEKRYPQFKRIQARLNQFDITDWPVEKQVDWYIVWAELNGYEFNYKILKPWQRDPAFYKSVWTYKSDVPAHEGPTHHAVTELWRYQFPLAAKAEQELIKDLTVIPSINAQAKINLTGNARELWIAGIRDIRQQSSVLNELMRRVEKDASEPLREAIEKARHSTDELANWLEKKSASKTGPSGIGKENYTWYLQNVHLVPLNWEDEVRLLQRELDRAWSSLKLEEHRNRNLPPLKSVTSPAEYDRLADTKAKAFLKFLDEQQIVTVADYFEPALMAHKGNFVPEETRHFFYIGSHLDPTPLYSHFYHWFELARMENEPHASPIRSGALLYNIFDSRNEGTATAVEEMFMHAGLYDDSPRSREIVWIMIAQRAARGLGSLYAHANDMTMEEAGNIHMDWTPRGWMKTEPELLIFEQHLYLRQPGYGTSYITGKYLLERAMAVYGKLIESQGKPFVSKDFFDELNRIGSIPIALGHWQMTGDKSALDSIVKNYTPLED